MIKLCARDTTWRRTVVAALFGPAIALSAAASATPCSSLTNVTLPAIQITAATSITSPITVTSPAGTATTSVSFCRVQGVARPSADSDILFEVWLPPTRATWNGRLKMEATGGYLGGVPYPRMAQELALGFAEAGSDLGHEGGQSPSWDLHPEKVKDYGYRAHLYVTTAAKAVIKAFYGQPPHHSYFDGCSGGGRQAQMVAQRYPELFDGVLTGAPSMFYPDVIMQIDWQTQLQLPVAGGNPVIPFAKLPFVSASVTAACDAKDGLVDGQITDPRACAFDPSVLQCTSGDAINCLTPPQLTVLRETYRGPHTTAGAPLWEGPFPGSEFVWHGLGDIADVGGYGSFIGDVVFQDPTFAFRTINYDTQYQLIREVLDPLTAAPSPDLSRFKAHGGKMIQYHGWFDPIVTPQESPNYYNALTLFEKFREDPARLDHITPHEVAALALKDHEVGEYFRLFMVPNMSHCQGGSGPNSFNQLNTAPSPSADPDHDVVEALILWVEQGIPPEKIIATEYANNDPTQGVVRQRPVCAYPKVAEYTGTGDINVASNFRCASPDAGNLTPTAGDMVEIRDSLELRNIFRDDQHHDRDHYDDGASRD